MGVAMQRGSDLNRVNQHYHDHKHCQTLDIYQMRPRSRKWDEKNTLMLNSGSLRKSSIRAASSWVLANSSPSSESESESSDLASGSASGIKSLGAGGAGFCFSRPIYIRN